MCYSFNGFIRQPIFPADKHHAHIKHVRHNKSCCLFIEAIRWLSYYDCYNSPSVCVCGERMAPVICVVKPHTVAIYTLYKIHTSLFCLRALVWRHITPVQHGDWLPTKTEKWKQSSLHPDLHSEWSYSLCHNITSPLLQYLDTQPRPLFIFYSEINFFPHLFSDRLPLADTHTHTHTPQNYSLTL